MEGAEEVPSSRSSPRCTRCPSSAKRAMVAGGHGEKLGRAGRPAWGLSAPSPLTSIHLLTIWGHLPLTLQVGSEGHQAAPGVDQLPVAS